MTGHKVPSLGRVARDSAARCWKPARILRHILITLLTTAAILLAGGAVLVSVYAIYLEIGNPSLSDFIGYWAGAHQLVRHANPYDVPTCLALEHAAGYSASEPRVTPSPPIALILLWPVGLLGPKAGLFAWTMTMLALLALCLRLLGRIFAPRGSLVLLAGFLFAPALSCLEAGQLGILFLASVTLFLIWHEKHPFLAGVALLPLALKPHLFGAFVLALLLWIAVRRAWLVLAGAAAASCISAAVTFALDPAIWPQYFAFLRHASLANRYTPTLSVGLPLLFGTPASGLRFLPTALVCLWAVWYFLTGHARWHWDREGLVVLTAAVACSPYAWFTDEAVLLPAVFAAFFRAPGFGRPAWPVAAVAAIPLAELGLTADIKSWVFVWTPLAWLACALYALPKKKSREPEPAAS